VLLLVNFASRRRWTKTLLHGREKVKNRRRFRQMCRFQHIMCRQLSQCLFLFRVLTRWLSITWESPLHWLDCCWLSTNLGRENIDKFLNQSWGDPLKVILDISCSGDWLSSSMKSASKGLCFQSMSSSSSRGSSISLFFISSASLIGVGRGFFVDVEYGGVRPRNTAYCRSP